MIVFIELQMFSCSPILGHRLSSKFCQEESYHIKFV